MAHERRSEAETIRKQVKALRQERSFDTDGRFLPERQASDLRNKLAEILDEQPFLKQVLCFYPFGSEIPLLPLYKKIIAKYSLYFPVTGEQDLTFYRVSFIEDASFVSGKMGISEPSERSEAYGNASDGAHPCGQTGFYPREKGGFQNGLYETAAIVPGLAFSSQNMGRIGYGGGYYDRFLAEHPGIFKIGVCYGFQLVDSLPQDPWDVPMDCIVTDAQVIGKGGLRVDNG